MISTLAVRWHKLFINRCTQKRRTLAGYHCWCVGVASLLLASVETMRECTTEFNWSTMSDMIDLRRRKLLAKYSLSGNLLYQKGKGAYSSSWNSPQNYGTPLVNGITQCYMPPDRGDRPAFTPTGLVGTRFIDPVRMKGWVGETCEIRVNCIRYSLCCVIVFYTFLPPTKEEVHVFASVCLFVCLSVSKITQKRVHGFGWNVAWRQNVGTWTNSWLTFEPDPDHSPDAGTVLLSPISHRLRNFAALHTLPASCAATRNFTSGKSNVWRAARPSRGFKMVIFTEPSEDLCRR